ncbi:MAG: hypothetical protein AAF847_09255 [Bacteroidota bacterium]
MSKTSKILLLIGTAVGLLVLFRFSFFLLRFALLFIFLIVVALYLKQLWQEKQAEEILDETEKSILEKLNYSKNQIEKIQQEQQKIQADIENLQAELNNEAAISPNIRRESERLLNEFEQENNLRKTKLSFYENCIIELEKLLNNYRLSKALEQKQANLKQLRENNLEDIADLEAFKTAIEFESRYLATIDELSLKMLDSHSLQDAQSLRLELEKITDELKSKDK